MRETDDQRMKREGNDNHIHWDLMQQDDPYERESNVRNIWIGKELYSIHWILCYAQARNAGVSCLYTSQNYAYQRMWTVYRDSRTCEYHAVKTRKKDCWILYLAQRHLNEKRLLQERLQRLTKQAKGRKVEYAYA